MSYIENNVKNKQQKKIQRTEAWHSNNVEDFLDSNKFNFKLHLNELSGNLCRSSRGVGNHSCQRKFQQTEAFTNASVKCSRQRVYYRTSLVLGITRVVLWMAEADFHMTSRDYLRFWTYPKSAITFVCSKLTT